MNGRATKKDRQTEKERDRDRHSGKERERDGGGGVRNIETQSLFVPGSRCGVRGV